MAIRTIVALFDASRIALRVDDEDARWGDNEVIDVRTSPRDTPVVD